MIIGFSTNNKNILSNLIRFFTESKISHTFLLFEAHEQTFVLHASDRGISISNFKKFKQENTLVKLFMIDINNEEQAIQFALTKLDIEYDYIGALGYLWVLLMRKLGKKTVNPLVTRTKEICSKFITEILAFDNYKDYASLDAATIDPEDLLEMLSKDSNAKEM